MKKHSIISPSASHRWLHCLGSAKLEARYPDVTSPYAQEGTDAHRLLEKCLLTGYNAAWWLGKDLMREDGGLFFVTEEMAGHVQTALDYVSEEMARLPGSAMTPETRYELPWVHEELAGTCDVTICQRFGELVVIDFKYGQGVEVEVVDNPQLMIYALGALGKRSALDAYETVKLVIIQPRKSSQPKEWVVTPDDLYKWEKNLAAKAKQAVKGSKSFVPGDWCQFCKACADCPKLRTQAMAVAGEVFGGEILPVPNALTPADIGTILPKLDIFKTWEKAVRDRAEQLLLSGVSIPGFKVVEGRTNRAWKDETEAAADLTRAQPFHSALFYVSKLLSPAQLEKVIKTQVPEGDRDLLFQVMNESLADKTGKPTVVPESDKRPALVLHTAAEVFSTDKEFLE